MNFKEHFVFGETMRNSHIHMVIFQFRKCLPPKMMAGNSWFAVSAWDQSSLTGMTLLWKLSLAERSIVA